MKKIEMLKNKVKSMREEAGQEGFSLIELVVAVGILAILSVVGVVAYSQITENARQQSVNAAAAEIYTAAVAKEAAGDTTDGAQKAAEEWLSSAGAGKFTVHIDEATNSVKVQSTVGKQPTAVKGSAAESAITTEVNPSA